MICIGRRIIVSAIVLLAACCAASRSDATTSLGPGNYSELDVKPSTTDPSIHAEDLPSRIFYNRAVPDNKILLWLAGTNGNSEHLPADLLHTALEHGYRVVVLSYITDQAVSGICAARFLQNAPKCAEQFREKRIYGDGAFSRIPDQPQDAIVNRFEKLLSYLSVADPSGHWAQYLADGHIQWNKVAIAGQSQGGGMAEFIGMREMTDRILAFSGGWDFSSQGHIAAWYFGKTHTPADRWFATYHVEENFAGPLAESYQALGIPPDHVFALNAPLPQGRGRGNGASKNPYHGQGISNPAYQSIWEKMLGSGLNHAGDSGRP